MVSRLPEYVTDGENVQFKDWSENHGGAERLIELPKIGWERISRRRRRGDVELGIAMAVGLQGKAWKPKHH